MLGFDCKLTQIPLMSIENGLTDGFWSLVYVDSIDADEQPAGCDYGYGGAGRGENSCAEGWALRMSGLLERRPVAEMRK